MRFRFEYPALVADAGRAVLSDGYRDRARLVALGVLASLAVPAALLIWAGAGGVDDALGLSLAIVVWPIVLDVAGARERRQLAGGEESSSAADFDRFWFALTFGLGALAMLLALGFTDDIHASDREAAMLAGVALVWFLDALRSGIALGLASNEGFPLYGEDAVRI